MNDSQRRRPLHLLPLLLALLCTRAAAQGGWDATAVDRLVDELAPAIVDIRHRIHANPELGNREVETARLVAEHLRGLGFDVQTGVAHTGVVGVLRGGRPGPTVAVRADMDALPVVEETDLPFKSTVRTTYLGQEVGVMHACGHDVHTSVQLGVASVLAALRAELPGTVKLIFQPAEEGPPPGEEGGAELMVAEGVLRDPTPEAIFGLHSEPRFEVGEVGFAPGPAWAAVDHFRVKIRGKQAHGAAPQDSVDPIVMASQAVTALQTIRSRNLPPMAPSVITVGIIRGGTRYNIIPGEVELEGTVRTYDPALQDMVERRMHEILDGITRAGGGGYEMEYDRITPVVINDRSLGEQMLPTLKRVLGDARVHDIEPQMAGEDFAYFANEVPGFFYRLGTRTPGGESGGLHTPNFVADDAAVAAGMRLMSSVVLDYLHSRSGGR